MQREKHIRISASPRPARHISVWKPFVPAGVEPASTCACFGLHRRATATLSTAGLLRSRPARWHVSMPTAAPRCIMRHTELSHFRVHGAGAAILRAGHEVRHFLPVAAAVAVAARGGGAGGGGGRCWWRPPAVLIRSGAQYDVRPRGRSRNGRDRRTPAAAPPWPACPPP